jgi:chaperonin GroES
MGDFLLGVKPRPLNGRVMVKMQGGEYETSGGIIVPSTTSERPMCGEVVETSEGYYDNGIFRRHTVQIGDTVIFPWKAGFDLYLEDEGKSEEYRFVHETEIIAILGGVNLYG